MSWFWGLASGCVATLLETSRAIVAKFSHQQRSTISDDGSLTEELQQANERSTAIISIAPAAGPCQKLYQCFYELGIVWMTISDQGRIRAALEESIRLLGTAVSLCPPSAPEQEDILLALSNVLEERYNISGSDDNLQGCIDVLRKIVELRPPGHLDRSRPINNLAAALSARYSRLGDIADVEEGILLRKEALGLRPAGHPYRSVSLNNLAVAFNTRYERLGDIADLEEHIRLHQEALALRPVGNSDRPRSLYNLASAFNERYARLGELADLERSIRLHQEVLVLRPQGHPNRPASLNNLAVALGARYERLGNIEDLEEHIRLHQETLEVCTVAHPNRSAFINNLAVALRDRYDRFGDFVDLEERIRLHQEALELCSEDHPNRPASLNNLAIALRDRYVRLGEVADLEAHIRLHQEALELRPEGHPSRFEFLSNLANALSARYARCGDVADLEEGIRLHQEALDLCPVTHPNRSGSLTNLANALSTRYDRLRSVVDMEEYIRLYKEALELCPAIHPNRSGSLNNLAHALSTRYESLGNIADLEECIRVHQEALALRPRGHPDRSASLYSLAIGLSGRFARLGEITDLEVAISHLRSGSTDAISSHVIALHCALKWIDIAEEHRHASVEEAFMTAVASLRQYLSIGPTTQLQYTALLRETRVAPLPVDAAAYFIEKGNVERAIELLDEGRALLISEMRRFREPLPPKEWSMIGDELSIRYLDLCKDLRNLSNSEISFEISSASFTGTKPDAIGARPKAAYGEVVKEKRMKMDEYTDLLRQIRQTPGCEDFQRPPRFAKLKDAAMDGPIIVINCSKRRSDAIIVFSHQSPLHIQLREGFFQIMQHVSECYLAKLSELDATSDISLAISRILELVAKQLWTNVVRQIVEALQAHDVPQGSRIWWCPTSFLTSLPFHAAGNGSKWLIDYYVSSYTPTLSALISARQAATAIHKPSPPRILVVAQTKTSGLKNAALELRELQKLTSFRQCLDEEEATPQAVAEHMPSCDWAHFICHGTTADNPFESYLHLYEASKFTLNDIIKLDHKDAKFAFLAACHSAAQSRDEKALRDEVLHLAVAMQISGFRSVVGTMWQMEDEDGPVVAQKFYEEMLKDGCGGEEAHTMAAHALWKTVRWLKDESMKVKEASGEKCKKKKKDQEAGDDGNGDGTKPKTKQEEREGKNKNKSKKKGELPMARWANYIHIGA